jgi:hypothetical protein
MKTFVYWMPLLLFLLAVQGICQEWESTVDLGGWGAVCVGDESAPPSATKKQVPWQAGRLAGGGCRYGPTGWEFKDSMAIELHLPPRGHLVLSFDPQTDSLELVEKPDDLSDLAREALDYAPEWLRAKLWDSFSRLGDLQDTYALRILNAEDPRWVDEIAYQVATIGHEILADSTFDPDLVVDNARYLYGNDDSLHYATILDYGQPPWGDYWSTVGYYVIEASDTVEYLIPREIYYDHVVHPQMSDESPRMDAYVYNRLWRDYLFFDADPSYPILYEKLIPVMVLWEVSDTALILPGDRPFDPTDVALDVIGNWVSKTVPSLASGNRPIQPNVIAHEHNGNCGEVQDVLQAAARSALIPVVSTMDVCEDHVWNEFYYEGWKPYQVDRGGGVTHVNDPGVAYDEQQGGSKRVSSVWNWQSDGYAWTVTGRYSNCCSLHVWVFDRMGRPADSTRILIYSEGIYGGMEVTTLGFADHDGYCGFELGDLRNFYIHINSPLGDYPEGSSEVVQIISCSQTGAHYNKTFYLTGVHPAPRVELESLPEDTVCVHKMEIAFTAPYQLLHGYMRTRRDCEDPNAFYHTYPRQLTEGMIDLFVVDGPNYNLYASGQPFEAAMIGEWISSLDTSFVAPARGSWYIICSNQARINTSQGLELSLKLYRNPDVACEELQEPGFDAVPFRLGPAWPTPFSDRTTITYSIPDGGERARTTLRIYDVSGRVVRTLVNAQHKPGEHRSIWDGRDEWGIEAPSSVYFYRLTWGSLEQTGKLVLLR